MIRIRHRTPSRPRAPRLCRALDLALPTAWGAVAITFKLVCPLAQQSGLGARIMSSAVFFAVGTGLILHVRRGFLRELHQLRRIAGAAQNVLLRPLPPRIDGLAVAAGQLSADRGATVGGDLYEVVATDHGVRIVMGDVRGHGLAALATVAAVLGSFREAAHDEAELACVLRRLERAMARHLRERARDEHPAAGGAEPASPVAEEFVTVLLLEIRGDGEVIALNCGHPWPYLLRSRVGPAAAARGYAEPVAGGDPLPPLGPFPLPAELPVVACGRLLPGEGLLLHTDGLEDARDARGRFFPLQAALAEAVRVQPVVPQAVIRTVYDRLLRHTGGLPADDAALLVLRNDRRRVPVQHGEPRVHSGAK
ncbi:PP2C family protein-serine/threonine phosphatase [Streptomyces sp. NPDC058067]|uniref:PP2C family protein-serine/threonine phosphatase n=1 Tax=Streptomyces sp. NPDC058067 TaxID=3346324 RepID=UPI0036E43ACD